MRYEKFIRLEQKKRVFKIKKTVVVLTVIKITVMTIMVIMIIIKLII